MPTITDFDDPDIIDHPQLANVYGGYGIIDSQGRGYHAVQFDQPERRSRGRPSLTETQRTLNNVMCCWGLRAYHTAREFGHTPDEAHEMVKDHAWRVCGEMGTSVLAFGRRHCQATFGIDVRELTLEVQRTMQAAREHSSDTPTLILKAEFATFDNIGRAYSRSRSYEGGLYEAFYGRAPGSFSDKLALAFNPRPSEQHFSLPLAAQLTMLTGVNMAFLWQEQWLYRLIFDAIAAIHDWRRSEPATLAPEELYTLFRCVQSADPHGGREHDLVKNFIAIQVDHFYGDRQAFLDKARSDLLDAGLLRHPPQTVFELLHRSDALIEPSGEHRKFTLLPQAQQHLA